MYQNNITDFKYVRKKNCGKIIIILPIFYVLLKIRANVENYKIT
jgi:hypothetical protein